jgi:hypothetical protein
MRIPPDKSEGRLLCTLIAARLLDLLEHAFVCVFVAEQAAFSGGVERLETVVVEGAHFLHTSHAETGNYMDQNDTSPNRDQCRQSAQKE